MLAGLAPQIFKVSLSSLRVPGHSHQIFSSGQARSGESSRFVKVPGHFSLIPAKGSLCSGAPGTSGQARTGELVDARMGGGWGGVPTENGLLPPRSHPGGPPHPLGWWLTPETHPPCVHPPPCTSGHARSGGCGGRVRIIPQIFKWNGLGGFQLQGPIPTGFLIRSGQKWGIQPIC